MKKLLTVFIAIILFTAGVLAQNKYVPITAEYYKPIYGNCSDLEVKPPKNGPWYVFSDRANNPITNGSKEIAKLELGQEFLVIGQNGNKLEVIDATKVNTDMLTGTFEFKSGENSSTTLRGWIDKNNLLLSNECLKVCDIEIPSAPKGLFNLQALYIYNVVNNENHRVFAHAPNNYESGVTDQDESDRIGYVFKVKQIGNEEWFLIGQYDKINIGNLDIVLKGWKPKSQIELWKHRLALEYDWYNTNERDTRLAILKDEHASSISENNYDGADFVDREYNYFIGTPDINYYHQRALGSGFRNVILNEENESFRIGVLKNSENVSPKIIDPARGIANGIISMLYQPKVIFVLDGTESIIKDPDRKGRILETIKTTIGNIRKNNAGKMIEYQFGACIYRDQAYGKYLFETTQTLNSNIVQVSDWIDKNLVVKTEGKTDPDQEEAVFYGVQKAFNHFQQQIDFFNPTFYVLIGDAGSHNRDDETNVAIDEIQDFLKCNVCDLSAIQFSHRTDVANDEGKAYDAFQQQFENVLSVFGEGETEDITNGEKRRYLERPGSFLAYPANRGEEFGVELSEIIELALMNYNTTLQQKIRHLAFLLSNNDNQCASAQKKLQEFIEKYVNEFSINQNNIDQITEWAIRFIVNAAADIKTEGTKLEIKTSHGYNFFNPGFVCSNYDFMNYAPFQHVIYMRGNDLDNILEFSGRMINLSGKTTRGNIQKIWQYILINVLGVLQKPDQVNELTITDATSILTGFKGNDIYKDIKIGQITQRDHFPDELLFKYIYEWIITNGYIQSVKNGSWELSNRNLRSKTNVMNALRKMQQQPPISAQELNKMSKELAKTDHQDLATYYKNYPSEIIDQTYGIKVYWIEANFFSSEKNNFVELLSPQY